jgi:hypothetical protein
MTQEVESSSKKNLRSFFKFVSVEERVQGIHSTKGRPKGPRKVEAKASENPVMTGRAKLRQVLQDNNSKSSSR